MAVENWDEIRTAYQVARMGTVSGAAEAMGVHHATVIRHIDAIEARLGVKLFQRHARGYTATEAGADLLQVAQATDDQFSQLVGRIKGRGSEVTGELVVTSLSQLSRLLAPSMVRFREMHPGLTLRFLTGERLFRLEYGEAHIALRAGSAPQDPDNVVQELGNPPMALYAARQYIDAHGMPGDDEDLKNHFFVGHDDSKNRAPFNVWLWQNIPPENIVFRATEPRVIQDAIVAGAGIGFLPPADACQFGDLVEVRGPRKEWSSRLWIVTHVDLHRTTKVQAFLKFLKEEAKSWGIL